MSNETTEAPASKRRNVRPARATKTTAKAMSDGAGEVAQFDSVAILAEMREMRAKMETLGSENAALQSRLEQAEQKASEFDEYGLKNDALAGIGVTNIGTDVPANLEVKLDCMERLAAQQREPFDRARTRDIYLGKPVADLNEDSKCAVCGKTNPTWAVEEVLSAHEVACAKKKDNAITRANAA